MEDEEEVTAAYECLRPGGLGAGFLAGRGGGGGGGGVGGGAALRAATSAERVASIPDSWVIMVSSVARHCSSPGAGVLIAGGGDGVLV